MTRLLRAAGNRTRKDLLGERVGNGASAIPIGKKFWPLTDEEHAAIAKLVEKPRFRRLVTSLTSRKNHDPVTFVDAAYWVKGCSSLGLWRVAVLVRVGGRGKGRRGGTLALVDVKQGRKPLAPRGRGATLPSHDGERVVAGARALSPNLGTRMIAATVMNKPVFVRELLPQDIKFELDEMADADVDDVSTCLGSVIAIAHARQLTSAQCAGWLEAFRREHAPRSTAPAWLWAAVVDLVALHEGAYLEHCRGHAATNAPAAVPGAAPADVVSHHVSGD